MSTQTTNTPPLLGYHFCNIRQSNQPGENPFIYCVGQITASESEGLYLATFLFAAGQPYSRLVTSDELQQYTLFPSEEALNAFTKDFYASFTDDTVVDVVDDDDADQGEETENPSVA
jgi:hypothetical protein